jgi:divinyl protochlorophyllide a 8-vinyl-reductase
MSETGLIGPNAILQLLPVLERAGGLGLRDRLLRAAGAEVPDGSAMIAETHAAHLHREVRHLMPDRAQIVMTEAGIATADYILAHRVPAPAQWLLQALPAPLAAPLLAKAINRHAWTFAGSGAFRVLSPTCFEITDNPLVRGEHATHPACHWHAAVFARLYQVLVNPGFRCVETDCCTVAGPVCRFELTRGLS